MRWTTPWRVLIGSREAILEAASTRWTLLVGFILVLSASLARKYDTVDLLAEPYELLHGAAAAMVNAFGIHLLFWALGSDSPRPAFWRSYLSFLGVFMLAAPMGWVYGVPYEQFLPAPAAVAANMWSLAVVSVVRVVWMTRVLNVLWEVGEGRRAGTFFAMMIYCDAVAIVALLTAPVPTLDVMGGLQQPEEIRIVAQTAFLAGAFAVLSSPIWLIGGGVALMTVERRWSVPAAGGTGVMPKPPIAAALVAVVGWSALLPIMQGPPRARTLVEDHFSRGEIREAVRVMLDRERRDLPPVWNPPPRIESGEWEHGPMLSVIAEALVAENRPPGWVDDLFGRKMVRWCTTKLARPWDTVVGPRYTGSDWTPPDDDARSNGWSGLDRDTRARVRTCLAFIRDRVNLTAEERDEVDRWVESGIEWEKTGAPSWDKLREKGPGG